VHFPFGVPVQVTLFVTSLIDPSLFLSLTAPLLSRFTALSAHLPSPSPLESLAAAVHPHALREMLSAVTW